MPAVLRSISFIVLMIWSLQASAQSAQPKAPIDLQSGFAATNDWIDFWLSENFDNHAGLGEIKRLEPEEFNPMKGLVSTEIEQPQHASNLADQNLKLRRQLEATRKVLTLIDTRATQLSRQREEIAAKAEQGQQQIAALEHELRKSREMNIKLSRANELLNTEMDKLPQEHHRLLDLESELDASKAKNNQLDQTNKKLIAEMEQLRQPSGWIAQLLNYHRGYVDAMSKVKVSAIEERESTALTRQLKTALGQDFVIPDLDAFGMIFLGGHVVPINGAATGRIVYEDSDANPLEFWLTSKMGQSSNVNFGQNGELNIVHWQGSDTEYVIISSVAWNELSVIAGKLYQLYND